MCDTPELTVAEIDELRFTAFRTNRPEDVEKYYKATSKYFQGHASRALSRHYDKEDMDYAVGRLVFEVSGAFEAYEEGLRSLMGDTNVHCVLGALKRVQDLLGENK